MGDHQQANHQRKGVLEQNRWILFMLCTGLMLFFTVWLMFFHVSEDGLYYPKDVTAGRIPMHWIQRAITYNSHDLNEYSNYTIINPNGRTILSDGESMTSSLRVRKTVKLVCYNNFPSDNDSLSLQPSDLEANLCTHIHLAFATVSNSQVSLTPNQIQIATDVMRLKEVNQSLKVLLSIGGAGNGQGYPQMVRDHANRKLFIGSVLQLIQQHRFDGIDLDWEFPGANSKERMHFTQLLHELRNEINRQTHFRFLLCVAVAAPVFIIDVAYDVAYMNEYVDYVNVMTYDYHFYTKITPFTGINAPLYARDVDIGYFATLNINYTIHYWLHLGLDRDKIVVGLPTFGHSFRLINAFNHGLSAPANGYGTLGTYGFVGYNEMCTFLRMNRISPMFDFTTRSPFATRHHEWVSFDDQQSLQYKAEFVRAMQLGGVMVYALNTDDFQGVCMANATSRFPLTKIIKWTLTK